MKVCCPQCGMFWKAEFKFCPNDGANLDEVRAMIGEQDAAETLRPMTPDEVVEEPAVDEVPEEVPTPEDGESQDTDDGAEPEEAVTDAPASEDEPADSAAPARRVRPQRTRPSRRSDAPQGSLETACEPTDAADDGPSEPDADAAGEASSPESPKERSDAPDASRRKAVTDPGFSETQWFMKGLEVDADILEAKADEEEYQRDDSIRTAVRNQFSLRKDEDEE